jgi:hypothetical protein
MKKNKINYPTKIELLHVISLILPLNTEGVNGYNLLIYN